MKAAVGDRVQVRREAADDVLRSLPARSVNVLVTDPPYATVSRDAKRGTHMRDWFGRSLGWPAIGRTLRLARTRMAPDGVAFVMTNAAGLDGALDAVEAAGFVPPFRVIAWDRQWPSLGHGLRHRVEYVVVGRLPGSRTLVGSDLVSVAAVGSGSADRYPTEKPSGLGRELARIAVVKRSDLVVDPFCGSGALLVGAVERGARVLGSDVSARAVRLARERLLVRAAGGRNGVVVRGSPPSLEGRRRAAKPASRKSARTASDAGTGVKTKSRTARGSTAHGSGKSVPSKPSRNTRTSAATKRFGTGSRRRKPSR